MGALISDVACVIPTRGNVPLEPVLGHLPFDDVGVWDNSTGEDLGVYGRYEAIGKVQAPIIYTQDDDVVVPLRSIDELLAAYRPGHVVCNVPAAFRQRYQDSGLVGFGAIFDRDLPAKAFSRFKFRPDLLKDVTMTMVDFELWKRRTSDLVFTMLVPMTQVDLPIEILDYAYGDDRMYRQPGHIDERIRMRKLCRQIRKQTGKRVAWRRRLKWASVKQSRSPGSGCKAARTK